MSAQLWIPTRGKSKDLLDHIRQHGSADDALVYAKGLGLGLATAQYIVQVWEKTWQSGSAIEGSTTPGKMKPGIARVQGLFGFGMGTIVEEGGCVSRIDWDDPKLKTFAPSYTPNTHFRRML